MDKRMHLKINEEEIFGTIEDVNKRWLQILKEHEGIGSDFISIQKTGTVNPMRYTLFYRTYEESRMRGHPDGGFL
jgi:hypothetical protein